MSGPQTSTVAAMHRGRIVVAHGGGGQLTDGLIGEVIAPRLANPVLDRMDDAAVLDVDAGRLAFTTDSFVVHPLEFPGGDIGRLAVCGTVNDLAVCGAAPRWLSLALILEEGLEMTLLERVLDSVAQAACEAGVLVVAGDTKVVARGQADGIYINTTGMGVVRPGVRLGEDQVMPGDVVILSGTIADHGMAVMLQREEQLTIRSELRSDVAPLHGLAAALLDAAPGVRFMRDPTRGGLSGVLDDLARRSGRRVTVDEATIPVRRSTSYAAEVLGIDPLDVANEGKLVAVVAPGQAENALAALRGHGLGRDAAVIGVIGREDDALCEMITDVGGRRILQKPYGEQLPRIC